MAIQSEPLHGASSFFSTFRQITRLYLEFWRLVDYDVYRRAEVEFDSTGTSTRKSVVKNADFHEGIILALRVQALKDRQLFV